MSDRSGAEGKMEITPERYLSVYGQFRDYLKHEDGLINERISRTMLLHGFLLAAYSILVQSISDVLSKPLGADTGACIGDKLASCITPDLARLHAAAENLSVLIAVLGFFAAIGSWIGVRAAASAICNLRSHYEVFESENKSMATKLCLPSLTGGGDGKNEWLGVLATMFLPWATTLLWAFVLANSLAPEIINRWVKAGRLAASTLAF